MDWGEQSGICICIAPKFCHADCPYPVSRAEVKKEPSEEMFETAMEKIKKCQT